MSDKFKAIVIDNQNEKFSREIKEIDNTQVKDGNVLVKVDYSSLNYKVKYYDLEQKKFFHWISKQENKKSLISLNLGLLLNSELHTDKDVYISNITNVPSTIKRNDLQKRLNLV